MSIGERWQQRRQGSFSRDTQTHRLFPANKHGGAGGAVADATHEASLGLGERLEEVEEHKVDVLRWGGGPTAVRRCNVTSALWPASWPGWPSLMRTGKQMAAVWCSPRRPLGALTKL